MSLVLNGSTIKNQWHPFYQIFRIFKAHKEILFKFFVTIFFSRSSLWRNNFMFNKSMCFPVIPDNSHDLLRTSGSYVFYEIIFWRHGSMNHVSSIMPVESRGGVGGGGSPHMKGVVMVVVSLRVVNFGFWAHFSLNFILERRKRLEAIGWISG